MTITRGRLLGKPRPEGRIVLRGRNFKTKYRLRHERSNCCENAESFALAGILLVASSLIPVAPNVLGSSVSESSLRPKVRMTYDAGQSYKKIDRTIAAEFVNHEANEVIDS